uniref:Actin-related protein 6 n=1 Tax=Phallusia mammillata TaxID=59560 RepID=A0A6F9D523_9ASCI|nr:actin-related protein 6-like [Phallusia mammillata]
MKNVVVLDNGACTLKICRSGETVVRTVPNSIFRSKTERRKSFVSSRIDSCKDFSSLFYVLPFQKGYLLNWDVQRQIWDFIFGKDVLNLKFNETSVIVTEPHFNFASIQESMNEIFFEEYEFNSIIRINASTLASHQYSHDNPEENCCLVVDSGYSFTHIVPYYKNRKIVEAVCRIDVGGKLITNHLKEVISYRQLQVMDETYVMNQVKEDACYISMSFNEEMATCKKKGKENTVLRDYVLPDYTQIKRGYIKPVEESKKPNPKSKTQEQTIRLTVERFTVPEILFHPSDVGISQMGLAEGILHSISKCPEKYRPHLLRNILLIGGNCLFPNFKERLEHDVRELAPDEQEIFIILPPDPTTYACQGGMTWSNSDGIKKHWLSQRDYQEGGQVTCAKYFPDI